jgi:hypothetical protein
MSAFTRADGPIPCDPHCDGADWRAFRLAVALEVVLVLGDLDLAVLGQCMRSTEHTYVRFARCPCT